MGNHRMFSLSVVDTDLFNDMPMSARLLYYELGMRADDDGFIASSKRIVRMTGCTEDDMKLLIAKGFIICFDSGIIAVAHWHIHNKIRKDRKKDTIFLEEKRRLALTENGVYTKQPQAVNQMSTNLQPTDNQMSTNWQPTDNQMTTNRQPTVNQVSTNLQPTVNQMSTNWQPTVNQVSTNWQPSGNQMSAQDKISKDKSSQDKLSQDKLSQEKLSQEKLSQENSLLSADADARPHFDFQSVVDSFNSICKSLPKVQILTDQRRLAIKKAQERLGNLCFDEFFAKVERSDFLTGRTGKWNGCGFDWIMQPYNMTKILEGNYDNRQTATKQADPPRVRSSYDLEELEKIDTLDFMDD